MTFVSLNDQAEHHDHFVEIREQKTEAHLKIYLTFISYEIQVRHMIQ